MSDVELILPEITEDMTEAQIYAIDVELGLIDSEKAENYSPQQARDGDGKWTDGGGGGGSVKPYNGKNSDSASKYIKDNYGDVTYSDDELRVINNYTGSMYARMNRTLRGKDATHPISETPERAKQTNDHIKVMDQAIAKTKLKSDQTLWRAATSSTQIKVGQTISDKGYGSTSMREQVADVFLGQNMSSSKKPVQYIMKINAKKGQTGIFAQNARNNSYENEFILPHDVEYKVTKVKKTDDFYEIEADLI